MYLHRIIGRRGSGKTTTALSQCYSNSPPRMASLYVYRNMHDANRCYRAFVERFRGYTCKRYEVEWSTRDVAPARLLRFVSPAVYEPIGREPIGRDFGDVTIDMPLADVSARWLDQVMLRMSGTLTIIAGESWARDMRAWQMFRRHCGPAFGRVMLLSTCHAPDHMTQAKVPIVIGERRPFTPSIWLPATPEVDCKPQPIPPRPRLTAVQRYREMMRELREASP